MILIVILYALIALTFPLAQYTTRYADPFFIISVRMTIAGSCLLAYHYFFAKKRTAIREGDFWLFVKAAIFHIYLAFVPEFWALQYLSALKVNIIYCATPFISALLELMLLGKAMSFKQLLGITIGSSGILFLAFSTTQPHCSLLSCTYPFLPELLLFLAVVSASYAWFVIKKLMHKNYDLTFINGTTMLIGGALSALTLPLFRRPEALVNNQMGFVITVAALIVLSNGIIYHLYGTLLKKYRPTLLSLAGFLSPLFGMLYAQFLFNEQLTWHYLIASLLVCSGILIFYERN